MFFKKSKVNQSAEPSRGLPKPAMIPDPVGTYLVTELKMDPDYVWKLKAATRPWPENKKVCHFRVYDERVTEREGKKILDYITLDTHPDLILFQGVLDRPFFKVVMKEEYNRPLFGEVH